MNNRFQEDKAIAALTYLMTLSNNISDKYWLNKVMYYIERESILQYGEPMFHDDLYSMRYGPVVSSVNDGIDSTDSRFKAENKWKNYILLEDKTNTVFLIAPGDFSLLSDSEIEIITEAYDKYKNYSFSEIMNDFHQLPEYDEIKLNQHPQRKPITYEELLLKNDFSPEDPAEIIKEINYSEKMAEPIYG